MHPATTHPATETRLSIEPRLKEMAQHAASELNIQVYGGECILSPDGDLRIIDFNDWPSFAPCRVQASTAIAKSVIGEIKNRK